MAQVEIGPEVSLYVEDFGEGPPVVFVTGVGVTHAFWEQQVGALVDSFRTISYDHRGSGGSSKPPSGYSVEIWAEDLRALIGALELDSPTLVGHGVGAHVALRYAATDPGTLANLVLVSGAPWFLGDREQQGGFSEDFWEQLKASWLRNRPQSELDLADAYYFHTDPGEAMRMAALQMALTWPLPVYLELGRTLPAVDHRDALASIEVPALVIHGRHDEKNRYEGGVYLAEHLPNAELVTLEDSAHCPNLEEPRRVGEALRAFLGAPVGVSG